MEPKTEKQFQINGPVTHSLQPKDKKTYWKHTPFSSYLD